MTEEQVLQAFNEPRLLLRVEEAADKLSIGRSLMYQLLRTGRIRSIRIGRCRRISARDLDGFVCQLEAQNFPS